ncbi:hypothetical protein MOV08_05365 [Streptomyces yunnanensis]|uniref:Excreted virulence factor EspC, type VII ESX diderm n=1 Tax=Streptomyces yunnanensis TaxID=156453 RepID=A0ABY8A4G6_9ACTN|nr:hypothetical protein [Streptomyces yunnanensis]WEB38790.1 hypothetical protein MOV08_05365 [Streptomyces yunnanensis]
MTNNGEKPGVFGALVGRVQRRHDIGLYVERQGGAIVNALHVYADKQGQAAAEAQHAYEAGQRDPEVRVKQDGSLVTNDGYRQAAEILRQSAQQARDIAITLSGMAEDADDFGD